MQFSVVMATSGDFDSFWKCLLIEDTVNNSKVLVSCSQSEILTLIDSYRKQSSTFQEKIKQRKDRFYTDLVAQMEIHKGNQDEIILEMESLERDLGKTSDVLEAQQCLDKIKSLSTLLDTTPTLEIIEKELRNATTESGRRFRNSQTDMLECSERVNKLKSEFKLTLMKEKAVLNCTINDFGEAFGTMLTLALSKEQDDLRKLQSELREKKYQTERTHLDRMQQLSQEHEKRINELNEKEHNKLTSLRQQIASIPNEAETEIFEINATIVQLQLKDHENRNEASEAEIKLQKMKKQINDERIEEEEREAKNIANKVELETKRNAIKKKIKETEKQLKILNNSENSKYRRLEKTFQSENDAITGKFDILKSELENEVFRDKIPIETNIIDLLERTNTTMKELIEIIMKNK